MFLVTTILWLAVGCWYGLGSDVRHPGGVPTAVFHLRITMANGMPMSLRVPEGGAGALRPAGGKGVRLEPRAVPSGLEIAVSTDDPLDPDPVPPETLILEPGFVAEYTGAQMTFQVEWTGTYPEDKQENSPTGPCQTCCVLCGGFLVCGCLVETPCGGCCCPDACVCDDAPVCAAPPGPRGPVSRR